MTGDGSQQHPDDVVEQGGRGFPSPNWRLLSWRPPRGAAILVAVGLLAGLAAGYAAGERQAASSARPPQRPAASASPGASLVAGSLALTQDSGACATQTGRELQLGVQVTNQSAADVTLRRVQLREDSWRACRTTIGNSTGDASGPRIQHRRGRAT